jgi:hypothetical protein
MTSWRVAHVQDARGKLAQEFAHAATGRIARGLFGSIFLRSDQAPQFATVCGGPLRNLRVSCGPQQMKRSSPPGQRPGRAVTAHSALRGVLAPRYG